MFPLVYNHLKLRVNEFLLLLNDIYINRLSGSPSTESGMLRRLQ